MDGIRDLVNSRSRVKLYQDLELTGQAHIMRRGIKMRFRAMTGSRPGKPAKGPTPHIVGALYWEARIAQKWTGGQAPSLTDAIREIERKISQ